jgi:hypothetical protein
MSDPQADFIDQPMEVTLTDGSRWIVYYRGCTSFGHALIYLVEDISQGKVMPADDLDGVQRRSTQINAAHIVSIREVDHE